MSTNLCFQISHFRFYSKPNVEEIKKTQKSFARRESNFNALATSLESGYTIKPAVYKGEEFEFQELFFVDVDNTDDIRTVEENIQKCSELNLIPTVIYPTFSYTQKNQRHRLVFAVERIHDINIRNEIQNILSSLFGGDSASNKVSQIFFGGNAYFFRSEGYINAIEDIRNAYKGGVTND